jgi:hypothetical protein
LAAIHRSGSTIPSSISASFFGRSSTPPVPISPITESAVACAFSPRSASSRSAATHASQSFFENAPGPLASGKSVVEAHRSVVARSFGAPPPVAPMSSPAGNVTCDGWRPGIESAASHRRCAFGADTPSSASGTAPSSVADASAPATRSTASPSSRVHPTSVFRRTSACGRLCSNGSKSK